MWTKLSKSGLLFVSQDFGESTVCLLVSAFQQYGCENDFS